MQKKLIIVESPTKAKTISSFVSDEYEIVSSKGHIRDLATRGKGGLGLDIENNFEPMYEIIKEKKQVVKELKKAAKDKEVYLASDPDREGEAIAWHLSEVLELDINKKNRVTFNEITKNTVLKQLEKPTKINMELVNSQEARRALDRIIGFKLSTILQRKKIGQGAGRVQSVALKLIVDREREILSFIPEKYFDVTFENKDLKAEYIKPQNYLILEEEANKIKKEVGNETTVKTISKREKTSSPRLAYTTSSLQQDANTVHGYTAYRTMQVAQKLFEGIEINGETTGLITYPRPDSNRLSNEFVKTCFLYIENKYGKNYVGTYRVKDKKTTQGAHEAIRPTDISLTPDDAKKYLTNQEFNIYRLIYNRTIQSLMSPAKFDVTTIVLEKNKHEFKVEGQINIFPGYQIITGPEKDIIIPNLKQGEKVKGEVILSKNETKPKPRYSEATLIKEMERLGIGRPSTYATTMTALKRHSYTVIEKKRFKPTDLGMQVSDILQKFFGDIINEKFTSNMESSLDLIALGKENLTTILEGFYDPFIKKVEYADENLEKNPPKLLEENCPECGSQLAIKRSRYGEFVACTNFPKCKYTRNIEGKKTYRKWNKKKKKTEESN